MNIRSLKQYALLAMVLIGISFSLPPQAQSHGGGGGGGRGGSHGGGWGGHGGGGRSGGGWRGGGGPGWWGLGLGVGLGWDAVSFANPYLDYSYPGYYYFDSSPMYPDGSPTVIVGPSMPPQATGMVAPPSSATPSSWYFCDSAKGYYPYVTQCPQPWRTVPAMPPGPVR